MNRRSLLAFFGVSAAAGAAAAAAATEGPEIYDTGDRVAVEDGDMIILNYPGTLSRDALLRMKDLVKRRFREDFGINVHVMVLQEDLTMQVLAKPTGEV